MKIVKKVSEKGRDFIAQHEGGYILKSYLCPAKVWTISAGCTYYTNGKRVEEGDFITLEDAKQLFARTLRDFEYGVWAATTDTINQNQFDALVSLAYNIGLGSFKNSTLLKKVNKNPNDPAIADEFMKWTYAAGKQLPGLKKRRQAESKLYFTI